ncbi:hypothetical protein [Flagellimonas sp. CMM7]|uniref:hypothetical protein n=1 Tax=Flagellimonas sp. CMM7 TaxID=2654676 RepID=UPI0013D81D40|nr:hypothetical protein [Flagellimonas sp. CMM7]UII80036.1 hypothetical protein LV704_00595 [Flagellimonas sp. CMM7]
MDSKQIISADQIANFATNQPLNLTREGKSNLRKTIKSMVLEYKDNFANQETKQLKEQNQRLREGVRKIEEMLGIAISYQLKEDMPITFEFIDKSLKKAEQLLKDLEPTKEQ